ncbi:class I SAM-dependent methyltransferase [Streptomyces sp. NPDC006743]|uniref:class I SAM-dependent methyltransferase n=1 Tax=Streptomyces sp. NPDC006743 TaxID=3154480 RepID=UPI0034533508
MTQSATLAGVFDDLAPRYDHEHHEEVARALLALAAPGPVDAVADVACGAGAVALQLARGRSAAAPPVLAVDVSPRMIEAGRARAAAEGLPATAVDWRLADAVPLPVADGCLDVVLCASSLHFLGGRAVADWRRALRPGGRVGFTLPLATHFRPSERFRALLAADVPLPGGAGEACAWAAASGFTDAAARVHVLGDRRVVVVSAVTPGGR